MTAEEPHTATLVRRARAGDRGAFGELYSAHAPMVHAVLVGMVAVREARDLVQDVFVAALDRLAQLEEPERFGAWVAAIARNRARDLLRAPRPTQVAADRELAAAASLVDPHEADPSASACAASEEAAQALLALRALPEAYRETLAMRLVEGLGGREIAARTGLTYGSVRVNLCRGMRLLRERLAEKRAELPRDREGGR